MSLLVSSLIMAVVMLASHIIRGQLKLRLYEDHLKHVLLEFIASAEMCTCAYELMVVANSYTKYVYGLYLFLMMLWWGQSWVPATACTYTLLEEHIEIGSNSKIMLWKMVAQIAGGCISYKLIKIIWLLEWSTTHMGQIDVLLENCRADLEVSVLTGFYLEFILTFLACIFSRALEIYRPQFAAVVNSFFVTTLVLSAYETTGGYFNPVLATIKLGCAGHTHLEHILVYWMGSVGGSMLALKTWNTKTFRETFITPFIKSDTKPKVQ
ncbi:unnamed protein product [Meganyctiphanes norvegica]|uniref:Aquaporin n=1 Tax=Meganyctiphanes norvegica TaxID=48144 RepID=A0AAV2R7M5_MEGNR